MRPASIPLGPQWCRPPRTQKQRRSDGTDYIAGKYNGRWRKDFEYSDVPDEVKFAIAEAALRELVTPIR